MSSIITIAATVPVTEAEGPGKRFAIWVQGCPFRCPGCCNPQYLSFESERAQTLAVDELLAEILSYRFEVKGVTFIGGEPFSQARPLADLAAELQRVGLSVMIFTGHTIEELNDQSHPEFDDRRALLGKTDLMVDGRYDRELHETKRRWIGSTNQRVHFLTDRYRSLEDGWPEDSNTIEIRMVNCAISINGFPHPQITSQSLDLLRKKKI